MVRLLSLAVLGWVAACGPAEPGLTMLVQPLPGGAAFDLRLFGQAVTCDAAQTPDGRLKLHTLQFCSAAEADTSVTCHMEHKRAQPGVTVRMNNVTPGVRVVFGLEMDSADKDIGWACSAAEVKVGALAEVTLAFKPN